ncbi:Rha family transcriptional regulator [Thermicanus aegyptius]|uniref:Rha family transcriptional regulator n=1 Tax=Thermicanus aegyptius TaxID=94009 RepID=UPI00040B1B36|nr:Rha family transcriptional regulator [Thermicanus aegyptius]
MPKLVLNPEYRLYERNGIAFCSSRQVAEEFGKEHYNVLRDIENLDCSAEFTALNFEVSKYKDPSGKWNKEYLITKDGFTFLVMGYRGKKAARFKEAYIRRFNEMEQFIRSLQAAKMEFPAFTEAIMAAHDEPKHYHFSNEINMIYRIVIGMDAKTFREKYGLPKGEVIRPYLTAEQIHAIETLQRVDIGLIIAVPEYEQRKQILAQHYERMKLKRIA